MTLCPVPLDPCPPILEFDYAQFILMFPFFNNPLIYPEATLQMWFCIATNYIANNGQCGPLNCQTKLYAIYLMMAHLMYLQNLIIGPSGGTVPYLMASATIDKVTVSLTAPVLYNQWQWWLMISPYGQQLFALLQTLSVGGFYIGGKPVLSGFYDSPTNYLSGGCSTDVC